MSEYPLQLIKRFVDGHKYFKDNEGVLHIADQSGSTPHEAEDGDLVIDANRKISADLEYSHFIIPLLTPSGEKVSTVATAQEAQWLATFALTLDEKATVLMTFFG